MKVRDIHIQNYRAITDCRLSFADSRGQIRPVSVIAGPNGSGKTSVLFALVQALRGVMKYRTRDVPPPTRDDIRQLPSQWSETPPETSVDVTLQFDDEEREFIPTIAVKLDPERRPPVLDDTGIRVHWKFPPGFNNKTGEPFDWWHADIEPRLPNVRTWLIIKALAIRAWTERSTSVPIRFAEVQQLGGIEFFPQDRSLRSRVVGRSTTKADGERSDRQGERSVTETLRYLSEFARNRTEQLRDEENPERLIQRIFQMVCAPKRYVGFLYREDEPLGSPVLEENQVRYPLSQAASGEQVILEYVTKLFSHGPMNKTVVLIDEPEMHLHPAWIRRFYMALPKIGRDNQYILTTHSAELRARAAADNCLIDLGQLDAEAHSPAASSQ